MTKTQQLEAVSDTVRYCWNHAQGDKEEEMVLWMAEHLAGKLGALYVLPYGDGREYVIDGTGTALAVTVRKACSPREP